MFPAKLKPAYWKETLARLAGESMDSPARVASAAALGVFFGIAPFWGFQLILALLAASLFKVNRVIAGVASNVSVPPMIPFIVYASLKTGGLVLGRSAVPVVFSRTAGMQAVKTYAGQYIAGSFLLAFVCAMAAWAIVYVSVPAFSGKKEILQSEI